MSSIGLRLVTAFVVVCSFAYPGLVSAQTPVDPSTMFAKEVIRVCIATSATPDLIRKLASQENWTSIDPKTVPAKNRIVVQGKKKDAALVYERTAAWTYMLNSVQLTVGIFDVPELALGNGRQCEIMAWDLDQSIVDRTLRADTSVKDNSIPIPGLPVKMYSVANTKLSINYVAGDMGVKVLHSVTVR